MVGLCLPLSPDDLIFGSHRSHGEILAKCARAIRVLPEAELQRIMEGYLDGDVLRVIEPAAQWGSVQELARHFILYGVLAEIFARTTGLNRGLGGSMHAFFAPFGSMPNNAIVGGSAPIAAGAALFKPLQPPPRHRGGQYRRRGRRLRADLGGHYLLRHGTVPHAVGRGRGRRPADAVQLPQQLLRHGRPDRWRDHGLRGAGAHRRRRQCRWATRRTGGRLRPAGGGRRRRRQAGTAGGGPRTGAARHGHLPPGGPFALRRRLLPDPRRGSPVAGGGLPGRLRRLPGRQRTGRRGRVGGGGGARRRQHGAGVPAGGVAGTLAAARPRSAPDRRRDVLQRVAHRPWPAASRSWPAAWPKTRAPPPSRNARAAPSARTASRCRARGW